MSDLAQKSRFLSLVLRHKPEQAGLTLDPAGWVGVDELLAGLRSVGRSMSREELERLVRESDKQRYAFSSDGARIRANQGHSVAVDLQLPTAEPPDILYHGTVEKFMASIESAGLSAQTRHHVHLSADRHTAFKVGSRRGKVVMLLVDARAMRTAGHDFFLSDNGVWLTESVPAAFLRRLVE